MVLSALKALVISPKSFAVSPLVFTLQSGAQMPQGRCDTRQIRSFKKTENFGSYKERMTTLLSLEIFSRDRWLLRAIKGGSFEINLPASLSLSRNSMRDKVNIAMYLVYLSWTVCRKIVTNKQGQVQAPILKLMRNITSRFMHPYSSDILIKPNLADGKATYIG